MADYAVIVNKDVPLMSVQKSADHLARNLLRNSALMVLSRVVGALTLIISVPFIIAFLGTDGFGVWESMLAVSGTAMVFQKVVSGTILWRIAVSYGKQDSIESQQLVRVGISATLMLIVAFVPLIVVFRDPILSGLQITGGWLGSARWQLPSIVGIMLLGGINEALLAVVIGYQRAGIASLILSLDLLVTNITSIAILALGGNLDSLFFGLLAGFAVKLLILYPLARSLCGRINLLPALPSWADVTVLGPFAGMLLLSNMTLLFRDQMDKIILAALASPTKVGYFAIAQRVSSVIMHISAVFTIPLAAAIAAQYARNDWNGVRMLYKKIGTCIMAGAGLATFLVCTLHEPLFVFWLGKPLPEAYGYLAMILMGLTSAVIFTGAGVALAKGIGRPGLETTYLLVTLVLVVLLKLPLILIFGADGSVAASAVSWCLGAAFFLFLLHRKIDLPRVMIVRAVGIALVTALLSAIGWWTSREFSCPPTRLTAATVVFALAPLLGAGYIGVLAAFSLVKLPRWKNMVEKEPEADLLEPSSSA